VVSAIGQKPIAKGPDVVAVACCHQSSPHQAYWLCRGWRLALNQPLAQRGRRPSCWLGNIVGGKHPSGDLAPKIVARELISVKVHYRLGCSAILIAQSF
jgi:hypothetical protein